MPRAYTAYRNSIVITSYDASACPVKKRWQTNQIAIPFHSNTVTFLAARTNRR